MKLSTIWKLLALCALGVISFAVSLMVVKGYAPTPSPDKRNTKVQGPQASITGWRPGAGPARPLGPGSVAGYTMQKIAVQVQGNDVAIAALAHILETRPGSVFVWSVRILDRPETGDVLFERRYDHQLFEVPPGEAAEPTFEDVVHVPLPPGNYYLELVTYRVPPVGGLELLDNAKAAKSFIAVRGGSAIQLGGGAGKGPKAAAPKNAGTKRK